MTTADLFLSIGYARN